MARTHTLIAFVLTGAGCATAPLVKGPGIPRDAQVSRIEVRPLDPGADHPRSISDRAGLEAALPLFAEDGWEQNDGMPMVPHYRVQVRQGDGSELSYFLGTFSDPPRAPCFSFCTGFWLAPAGADGNPSPGKFRTLATSGDLDRVSRLLGDGSPAAP